MPHHETIRLESYVGNREYHIVAGNADDVAEDVEGVVSRAGPALVFLRRAADENHLSAAVLNEVGVLMWDPPWGATPSYVSRNRGGVLEEAARYVDDDEQAAFLAGNGEPTYVGPENLVPRDVVLRAVRKYVLSGQSSDEVDWELV